MTDKEKDKVPEPPANTSLYAKFYKNEFLSDCLLEKTEPEAASYKAHRLVLAAHSAYFFKHFQDHKAADPLQKVPLPKFIKSSFSFDSQDVFTKVLEFFYSNQELPDLVKLGLNKDNAFSFLNHFAGLEYKKGESLTQGFIQKDVLNPQNCADCLQNAVKAKNQDLKEKCIGTMVPILSNLVDDQKKRQSLLGMPFEVLKEILARDDLVVQNENALLNLVIEYIQSKESLPSREEEAAKNAAPPKVEEKKEQAPANAAGKPEEKAPEKPEQKPAGKVEEKPAEKPEGKQAEKVEGKPAEKVEGKPAENAKDKPAEPKPEEKKPEAPAKPEEKKAEAPPADKKEDEKKPAEKKEDEKKPAEKKEDEKKPAEKKEDEKKPAEKKEGEKKPAENPEAKPEEKKKEEPAKPAEKKEEPAPEKPKPAAEKVEAPKVEAPKAPVAPDFETEAQNKLKPYKLTKEEKRELVKHLRLTHLSHEALIKASNMEIFSEFKDIFIESLSAKLNNYEAAESEKYSINVNPRKYTEPISSSPSKATTKVPSSPNDQRFASNRSQPPVGSSPNKYQTEPKGRFTPEKNVPQISGNVRMPENISANLSAGFSQVRQSENYAAPMNNTKGSPSYLNSPPRKNQSYYPEPHQANPHEYSSVPYNQTVDSRFYQSEPRFQRSVQDSLYHATPPKGGQKIERPYTNQFSKSDSKMQNPKTNESLSSTMYNQGKGSAIGGYQSFDTYKREGLPNIPRALKNPLVFSYKFDFDDNGVFYYLGSYGKQDTWQNPHETGQVQVFFSSLGKGALADFVGRECVNCRTLNEINSFMGVDLGVNRFIMPTCYTIKNRNSNHHVLLNWTLEASLDLKEWFNIDKRTHFTDDNLFNQNTAGVRDELRQKGAMSTWGIDEYQLESIKRNIEKNGRKFLGFRYFRITQLGKNSSGSYNMALSGFEVYGVALGDNWLF